MTEEELKAGLAHYIHTIGRLPPSQLGHKGPVTAFRMGLYVEGQDPQGRIWLADPAQVALGRLAWREWATYRDGKFGGREAVKPGDGNPLGGFGIGGLLTMLTGVPLSTALGSAPPPDNDAKVQEMLIQYLQRKASAR